MTYAKKNRGVSSAGTHPKNTLLKEESALYKAFVDPFVDVAKSVQLAGKDILSTLKLAFDTLITISPKKLREAREKYQNRRDRIDREWEPLMKKAKESVTDDVAIFAMAMAPSIFFGMQASKFATGATTSIVDTLEETGWKIPILSALGSGGGSGRGGKNFEEWIETQEREFKRAEATAERSTISGRLRVFFFGESFLHHGDRLLEANEEEKSKDPPAGSSIRAQLDEMVKEFLEPALAPAREALISAKKEQAEDLVGTAKVVIAGLRGLADSNKPEDFIAALDMLEANLQARGDKDAIDLTSIRSAVEKLKTDMSKKYEEIKSKQGPAPEGSNPEDIGLVAKKASEDAFQQAASELRKMAAAAAQKAIENYRETIAKELMSDIPTKGDIASAITRSPAGKEVIEMIKKAVDTIGQ